MGQYDRLWQRCTNLVISNICPNQFNLCTNHFFSVELVTKVKIYFVLTFCQLFLLTQGRRVLIRKDVKKLPIQIFVKSALFMHKSFIFCGTCDEK